MIKFNTAAAIACVALSATTASAARSPRRQSCNVSVDITDTDPSGANVRATPGGVVIAALRIATEGWIEAHDTAQLGDWYEIDRAELIPAGSPARRIIFQGEGYLHKRLVGFSGPTGGMPIYPGHADKTRPLTETRDTYDF